MSRARIYSELFAACALGALLLVWLGKAEAQPIPPAVFEIPEICKQKQCVFALRSDIEAQIQRAFAAGRAEGLQACRVASGSFT